jgi:hypothetical protein
MAAIASIRVLIEKLTVTVIVNKLQARYGTSSFSSVSVNPYAVTEVNEINPVYTVTYLSEIYFNIFLPPMPKYFM